jgi:UDP:flavonoid glycosyltransferase YjiC (YdhE family)
MQEAINRGVPLFGIPIFGDQSLNMLKDVSADYGVMVEFSNFTEESTSRGTSTSCWMSSLY